MRQNHQMSAKSSARSEMSEKLYEKQQIFLLHLLTVKDNLDKFQQIIDKRTPEEVLVFNQLNSYTTELWQKSTHLFKILKDISGADHLHQVDHFSSNVKVQHTEENRSAKDFTIKQEHTQDRPVKARSESHYSATIKIPITDIVHKQTQVKEEYIEEEEQLVESPQIEQIPCFGIRFNEDDYFEDRPELKRFDWGRIDQEISNELRGIPQLLDSGNQR